jgi:hypothetical protein
MLMRMRKSKPLISSRVSIHGRSVTRPLNEGIMAVPIPVEQRASVDAEMKDFISRNKQKEQYMNK